jgi:glycosyltransferase involved in cell wall biosynthesis
MYYRCLLPAVGLGCDYAGVAGDPPDLIFSTGIVKGQSVLPVLDEYKVVIVQQPAGEAWLAEIRRLQDLGIAVLFEIDDDLFSIRAQPDHDYREHFDLARLAEYEVCLRQCDGLIVSTPYLAERYRSFNKRAWVCPNGIDPGRYAYTRPKRERLSIGWSGATGHRDAALPWLQAVASVMTVRENVCFVSIGQPFAEAFKQHFPEERCLSVPWTAIETYPAAMTLFDIAIGPAAKTGFARGKSPLRYFEAGILGIPLVGHPYVYGKAIMDGVTGMLASTPQKVVAKLLMLVDNDDLRTTIGQNAKADVLANHTYQRTCQSWLAAARAVYSGDHSSRRLLAVDRTLGA